MAKSPPMCVLQQCVCSLMTEIFVESAQSRGSLGLWNEATAARGKRLNPSGPVPFTTLSDLNKNCKPSPHYKHKEPLILQPELLQEGSYHSAEGQNRYWNIKISLYTFIWFKQVFMCFALLFSESNNEDKHLFLLTGPEETTTVVGGNSLMCFFSWANNCGFEH